MKSIEERKNTQILITGAGGMIGSQIISKLYASGYDVTGLYKIQPVLTLPWKIIASDLVAENLSDKLKDFSFNVIIHCAANIPQNLEDSFDAYTVNHKIDENVLDYLKNNNSGIIYMSSTSLYGKRDDEKKENDSIIVGDLYSKGKFETENAIAELNTEIKVCLRVNAPYDCNQKNNTVLKIFIENALVNENIFYHGSGKREQDFTNVSDIATAIELILNTGKISGVYNISGGSPITMNELATLIVKSVPGCTSQIKSSGNIDPQEGCKARISIKKALTELGWHPQITLEKGIVNWINSRKE